MSYRAPPGRPICSPPNEDMFGNSEQAPASKRKYRKLTEAETANILRDAQAGMSPTAMAAKYDRARSVIDSVRRKLTSTPAPRPVQLPGESNTLYGHRVWAWKKEIDKQYAKEARNKQKKITRARVRNERRLADELCKTLNATETRGVWQTTRTVPKDADRKAAIESRRVRGLVRIYLMPAAPAPVVAPAEISPVVVESSVSTAPPMTMVQRVLSWVGIFR